MSRWTGTLRCFAVGLSLTQAVAAGEQVEARVLDSYTTTAETGETLVHRQVVLPNLETGEPEVFHQVLERNPDGSLTVVPELMSAELRARHEQFCGQRGGTTSIGSGVTVISPSVVDFFQCDGPVREDGPDGL